MSLFFNEQPIVLNTKLAKIIGLNESIVLQQIHYWLEINKKAGRNFRDGYYWSYNSFKMWKKENFDFWSMSTIVRIISKLEKKGFLISDNFNSKGFDRTKWYRIDYDKLEEIEKTPESLENTHFVKMTKSENITVSEDLENNKNINKTPESLENTHFVKMTKSFSQNDKMHFVKMTKPIPETNAETTHKSSSSSLADANKKTEKQKKSLTAFDDDEKRAKIKDTEKTKDIAKIEKVSSSTKTLNQENIKIIKETIKDNFNINLEENQVQILIKESNNDIKRLKELILLATTQNISNLFGWLISALNRPKERYKPISTTATNNNTSTSKSYGKNKFCNYTGRKWDYKKLEELEQQYLENSVKDIELNI